MVLAFAHLGAECMAGIVGGILMKKSKPNVGWLSRPPKSIDKVIPALVRLDGLRSPNHATLRGCRPGKNKAEKSRAEKWGPHLFARHFSAFKTPTSGTNVVI